MAVSLAQAKKTRPLYADVPCPEWGGDVTLRRLHAGDRLEIVMLADQMERDEEGRIKNNVDALRFGAELLARSIIDGDGQRSFDSVEGRDFLLTEDPTLMQRLTDEALVLNRLAQKDAEEALETAKKN